MVIFINRYQKYVFNGLILSCASLIVRGIGVAFNSYLSAHIGAVGMGLVTLCSGVYGFAITFACSGINLAVTRLISADLAKDGGRCGKIMRSSIAYCLFFSIIASVFLFSFADIIGGVLLSEKRVIASIRLFAISLCPISISSALNGYFCAVRRVYKNVIAQFCEQGVRISLVSYFVLILAPKGLEFACIAVVAGGVISEFLSAIISMILYFFDKRLHPQKSKNGTRSELYGICKIALPVAISAYVRSALLTLEHIAIPWGLRRCGLDYQKSLASYGILHGMVFPLLLFPSAVLSAFSSLLIPELSSANELCDNKRIRYIVSRVFGVSLLFAIGVSGIFISFSYELGYFLYGSREAGEYIRILSPLIPLMYLDGAVDAMLKGLGEQVYSMRVNITDSFISVILVVLILPKMGVMGYVVVIFITELINTSFSIIRLLNITRVKTPLVRWVIKPLLNIVLSTLIVRFLVDFGVFKALFGVVPYGKGFLFIEISLCAIFYIIISRVTGGVLKDEMKQIRRLVKS